MRRTVTIICIVFLAGTFRVFAQDESTPSATTAPANEPPRGVVTNKPTQDDEAHERIEERRASQTPSETQPPAEQPTRTILPGDANDDGRVDETDYDIWHSHYKKTVSGGYHDGDFNADGIADGVDYTVWLAHEGSSVAPTHKGKKPDK